MEWIWIRGWIGQFGLGMWRAFGLYKMALWLCWRFWGDFDVEDIRKYTFFETKCFFLGCLDWDTCIWCMYLRLRGFHRYS